jgi:hypothetical protein
MLLTTNINNTNTMIGLYDGTEWIASWQIKTDRAKQPDEHAMLLRNLFQHNRLSWSDVTGVALASVVPPMTASFVDMYQRYFHLDPLVVTNKIETGVKIRIDYPAEAGADRILNALAAGELNVKIKIVDCSTWFSDAYRGTEYDLTVIGHTGKLDSDGTLEGYGIEGRYVRWINPGTAKLIGQARKRVTGCVLRVAGCGVRVAGGRDQ